MRATRRSETELLVQDSSIWIAVICAAAAVFLVYAAALRGSRGAWVGAALFLLCGLVWIRKTTFLFDSGRRTVAWRKLAMLKSTAGTLSFDDITGVGEETSIADHGVQTYRLTLLLHGSSMPMSDTYSGGKELHARVRSEIQAFLGGTVETGSSLEDSVRSLLREGRKIDAVSLVRSEERLGLTEAVHRVDGIEQNMNADTAR